MPTSALKQAIELGYIPGPRIVPATDPIGATGGHCDFTVFPPSIKTPTDGVADGPEAIRAAVRKNRKYGAEVIKFCATGGVMSKGDTVGRPAIRPGGDDGTRERGAHARAARGRPCARHGGNQRRDPRRHRHHRALQPCRREKRLRSPRATARTSRWTSTTTTTSIAEGEKNGLFKESLDKERAIGAHAARDVSRPR